MQIIYLWVAKYKNITNQGFNFSPDFKCDYDEKSNELTIESKKHTRIFPNNINVTAIVGENGSGKSSLLQLLQNNFKGFYMQLFQNKLYCIFNGIKPTIKNKTKFQLIYVNYFNYLSSFALLEQPRIVYNIDYTLDKTHKELINYFIDVEHIKLFNNYFKPTTLYISRYINKYDRKFINIHQFCFKNKYEELIFELFKSLVSKLLENNYKIVKKNIKKEFRYKIFILLQSKDFQIFYKKLILLMKSLDRNFSDECYDISFMESLTKSIAQYQQYFEILYLNTHYTNKLIKQFIQDDDNDKFYIEVNITELSIKNIFLLQDFVFQGLLNDNLFNIEVFDKNKDLFFEDLSNGEQQLFRIKLKIEYLIHIEKSSEYVFLLDEPDNELHPNWQKKLLHYLIETFKDRENIHFIFTTHSPFLLSDLPKEKIIFLKKGKQVYPNIETFGANIHTLLSHGFFMDKGLMGEFAKNRINEIINFSKRVEDENNKEKPNFNNLKENYENNKKIFWNIYSIIGEEYLKQVIKNHLIEIEKILLGKDEAKQQKIERLQTELNKLQEESND